MEFPRQVGPRPCALNPSTVAPLYRVEFSSTLTLKDIKTTPGEVCATLAPSNRKLSLFSLSTDRVISLSILHWHWYYCSHRH